MDFDLFKSVIGQLDAPEIIRLNYSGESIHYPQLGEAIRLARATGAATELVTALASASDRILHEIVASGLDRLTVSLHAAEAGAFARIYRFSSLDAMRSRIEKLITLKQRLRAATPRLDLAFVAMAANLNQLPEVAAWAGEIGASGISVHPVLKRDPVEADFSGETSCGRITGAFRTALRDAIARAEASAPAVRIAVANPDFEETRALGGEPQACPGSLPAGARIAGCEQNPWETAHILAGGDVVACEVHDQRPLGNLAVQSLAEIWRGVMYSRFRRDYVVGRSAACANCPWKLAYLPAPLEPVIEPGRNGAAQLLRGWHEDEGQPIRWSKRDALLVLRRPYGGAAVRIRGILPAGNGSPNELTVTAGGRFLGIVGNDTRAAKPFDSTFRLPQPAEDVLYVGLKTSGIFRPWLQASQTGPVDERALGFALQRAEAVR